MQPAHRQPNRPCSAEQPVLAGRQHKPSSAAPHNTAERQPTHRPGGVDDVCGVGARGALERLGVRAGGAALVGVRQAGARRRYALQRL